MYLPLASGASAAKMPQTNSRRNDARGSGRTIYQVDGRTAPNLTSDRALRYWEEFTRLIPLRRSAPESLLSNSREEALAKRAKTDPGQLFRA